MMLMMMTTNNDDDNRNSEWIAGGYPIGLQIECIMFSRVLF